MMATAASPQARKKLCGEQPKEEVCPICLDDLSGNSRCNIDACVHLFCWGCLTNWVDVGGPSCPICRSEIERITRESDDVCHIMIRHLDAAPVPCNVAIEFISLLRAEYINGESGVLADWLDSAPNGIPGEVLSRILQRPLRQVLQSETVERGIATLATSWRAKHFPSCPLPSDSIAENFLFALTQEYVDQEQRALDKFMAVPLIVMDAYLPWNPFHICPRPEAGDMYKNVLDPIIQSVSKAVSPAQARERIKHLEREWKVGYLPLAPVPASIASGFIAALRSEFLEPKRPLATMSYFKYPNHRIQGLTSRQIEELLCPTYVQIAMFVGIYKTSGEAVGNVSVNKIICDLEDMWML
eukprot:TRINITY_DN359_c0_g1_i1.p1 TRINITY_DN359_c0_g1~~TRINITY_DN359_c0_g1_i1.p1  ORF type:complete len:356 (+),score=42.73 TRINITY_DN359_c0_g1_i1:245-1312(+)